MHTRWEEIGQRCGRCGGKLYQEVGRDGTLYPFFECETPGCVWVNAHVDALMEGEILPVPSALRRYNGYFQTHSRGDRDSNIGT